MSDEWAVEVMSDGSAPVQPSMPPRYIRWYQTIVEGDTMTRSVVDYDLSHIQRHPQDVIR